MPKPLPRDQPCASHDVKMGRVAVAIRLALRRAPAFVPCVRAQIRDHDGDVLAGAGAGALACRGVALVREVVAGAAAAAAPGSFAAYWGKEGGGP
jgi:hypothetical protein